MGRLRVRVRSEDVHGLRVAVKKLRSMARLMKNGAVVRPLREVYRACGAARQTEILAGILQVMVEGTSLDAKGAIAVLQKDRRRANAAIRLRAAEAEVHVDAVELELWRVRKSFTDEALLARISRRMKERRKHVCSMRKEIDDAVVLHDVRKSLKDLQYLLSVSQQSPLKAKRRRDVVHDAESYLGAVHDLCDLAQWLSERKSSCMPTSTRRRLARQITQRIEQETADAKRMLAWLCSLW